MLFPEYEETGVLYHIISITDLEKTLTEGIAYDDKATYKSKYYEFHSFIDEEKPDILPKWVVRHKAIFASINFPREHKFHSHSAILAVKVNEEKCWVANENLANQVYEPFILKDVKDFSACKDYLNTEGRKLLRKYWETSLSFQDNLAKRLDKLRGLDTEVLIFHEIPSKDIQLLYIISDHKMMTGSEWKERFCVYKN